MPAGVQCAAGLSQHGFHAHSARRVGGAQRRKLLELHLHVMELVRQEESELWDEGADALRLHANNLGDEGGEPPLSKPRGC